jgi:hypothetical protein
LGVESGGVVGEESRASDCPYASSFTRQSPPPIPPPPPQNEPPLVPTVPPLADSVGSSPEGDVAVFAAACSTLRAALAPALFVWALCQNALNSNGWR